MVEWCREGAGTDFGFNYTYAQRLFWGEFIPLVLA